MITSGLTRSQSVKILIDESSLSLVTDLSNNSSGVSFIWLIPIRDAVDDSKTHNGKITRKTKDMRLIE